MQAVGSSSTEYSANGFRAFINIAERLDHYLWNDDQRCFDNSKWLDSLKPSVSTQKRGYKN